jgi:hypothetical protein
MRVIKALTVINDESLNCLISIFKAIAGKECTLSRSIQVRLQGAKAGAKPGYVTVLATPKTGEKTSERVHSLTEIA